jgi:hypothetical protein
MAKVFYMSGPPTTTESKFSVITEFYIIIIFNRFFVGKQYLCSGKKSYFLISVHRPTKQIKHTNM